MRSEEAMVNLILNFARREENVRAVVMTGSRVNPNAPTDIFQDYDVACYVGDVSAYVDDRRFLNDFGDILIMQTPEEMGDVPAGGHDHFAYLLQFADGNRIDLTFCPLEWIDKVGTESLTKVLLDKDGRIPPLPPPSDKDFWVTPPTAVSFAHCCNEFWWINTYVAKGLWRDEIPYAMAMLDRFARPQLVKMLGWQVGSQHNFRISIGKHGKYLRRYLSPAQYAQLLATYLAGNADAIWEALHAMDRLFRASARHVANTFDFTYPTHEDENVTAYLAHVRSLSPDATSF